MRRVPADHTTRARNLRTTSTPAERLLWSRLRTHRPRFTRQLPAGTFIIDIACREARLAIELDSGQHADSPTDAARTAWLETQGWQVLRFWNNEVLENPDGVVLAILAAVESRTGLHPRPKPPRTRKPPT